MPVLAEYAAIWLDSIRSLVRPWTYEGYAYRLERHILPRLGQRRLDEIGLDEILTLISDLRECGYSGWSIRSMLTPLSRLFSHAVRRDVIAASPISKLDRSERPTVWKRELRVLNSEEIGRLLDAAPPRYRTLLACAILTGLRQSELLGLRWRDVDFEDELVHVRSALDRHGNDVPPKTEYAVRDVVLIPALAEILSEHREKSTFKDSVRTTCLFRGRARHCTGATSHGEPSHRRLPRPASNPCAGTTSDIRSRACSSAAAQASSSPRDSLATDRPTSRAPRLRASVRPCRAGPTDARSARGDTGRHHSNRGRRTAAEAN